MRAHAASVWSRRPSGRAEGTNGTVATVVAVLRLQNGSRWQFLGRSSNRLAPRDEINNESFVFFVSFCSKMRTTPWICYSSEAERRSGQVIGAAIGLRRILGPGLRRSYCMT